MSIDPSASPKQEGSVKEDILVNCVGSVTVTFITSGQSLSSLTSIVYVPAAKAENTLEFPQVIPPSIEYS